jgi:iron(III) transport system substrate-binding protein
MTFNNFVVRSDNFMPAKVGLNGFFSVPRPSRDCEVIFQRPAGFLHAAVKCLYLCVFAFFSLAANIAAAGNEEVLVKAQSLSGRAREEFLAAGAKREGEVTDYTSTNHQMSGPLVKLFEKKYPFIRVNLSRIGGSKIIQRAETEARAGLHAVDVIGTGELGIVALIDRGFIAKYASPLRESLREGFADKDDLWTVQHASLLFAAYNRNLVKPNEVPKSWDDFLDPKWKGKLSLDTEAFEWMGFLLTHMGEQRALRYFDRLTKQDVKFLRGRSLQLQLLAAGEFPITMVSNANLILDLKKAGAPIEPIRIPPVLLRPSLLLLAANAPHPHAAMLYLDFLLSKDGQHLLASSGRLPARTDVQTDDRELHEGLKFFMPNPLETGRNYKKLSVLFEKTLLKAK